MEAITHGEGRVIFNRRAPRSSDVNYVPYVKAERGKETMALNNSDELQSLVPGSAGTGSRGIIFDRGDY